MQPILRAKAISGRRRDETMNEKKPGNPWTKSLLIWVAVLFGLVLFVQMIDGGRAPPPGEPIPYSEFVRQVDEGNVQSVTIAATAERQPADHRQARQRQDLPHHRAGRRQRLRPADRQGRRGPGQGRGAVELLADPALPVAAVPADPRHQLLRHAPDAEECRLGRDGLRQEPRAKMLTEKQGRVTFADVAGIDEAREELQEIVEYPEGPGQVRAPRRQDPQGRAAGRLARHRQDPARPRHRG